MNGLEIERKYLIRMPDEAFVRALPGCQVWQIEQTYLQSGVPGEARRVRRVCENGGVKYYYTQKQRIDAMSCEEREREISESEFEALLLEADTRLRTVKKRRLRVPWCGQLLEIDLYDFWQDRATLEIELESETQPVCLPDWLCVVRELTGDRAYSNHSLAGHVPMEAL